MMRSLSSGVAGLRTHQTRMDVTGNNIANVNTYGFKASRATFSDVYYQNISGASSGRTGVQGGKNPTQIGYGASVATIDVMQNVGQGATTDFALDLYITGDGFLVSKDTSGKTMYTRLGKLDFDSAGNLVDGSGNLVQGFPMKDDGTPDIGSDGTIQGSELSTIFCDPEVLQKLKGITISPSGMVTGILPGDKIIKTAKVPPFIKKDTIAIDPESDFTGNVQLAVGAIPTKTQLATGLGGGITIEELDFGTVGLPGTDGTSITYSFSFDGNSTFTFVVNDPVNSANNATYEGVVQSDGTVTLKARGSSKIAFTMKVDPDNLPNTPTNPAYDATADMGKLKYQVTTRDEGDNVRKLPENATGEPDLFPSGTPGTDNWVKLQGLEGITIEINDNPTAVTPTVVSVGTAANDESIMYPIGNLAIAKFPNPGGMLEAGSSYFEQSPNSGDPIFVRPGLEGTGGVKSGYLEMSNVDVSKEFTDMITTQRGFQANSRIITVSDTMLEELVNLKR